MLYSLLRPALFAFEPERAHQLGFGLAETARKLGVLPQWRTAERPVEQMGLRFANPIGLAAGLDKNADHLRVLAHMGFGFIEVGTITPRAQEGNPQPRLFRLPEHGAIINRMGFNNAGLSHMVSRLEDWRRNPPTQPPLIGVNIGKNRDTQLDKAIDDYLLCLQATAPLADYITVNISSPNTPGLRELQHGSALDELLSALDGARHPGVPMLLKIAPDLDTEQLLGIADAVRRHHFDGIIATNTTNERSAIAGHPLAHEQGGLSGAPLSSASTTVLRTLRPALDGLTLIGVGGIHNAGTAQAKREAGADLVQIYSGLIYTGPTLVGEALRGFG